MAAINTERPPRGRCYRRGLGYREAQMLAYIADAIRVDGQPPSYSMIAAALNMDIGNVSHRIAGLERRGLLSRVGEGRVRRIRLHR